MTDEQKKRIETHLRILERRSKRFEEKEAEAEREGDAERAAKCRLKSECADYEWIGIDDCLKILGYTIIYPTDALGFKDWDNPTVVKM